MRLHSGTLAMCIILVAYLHRPLIEKGRTVLQEQKGAFLFTDNIQAMQSPKGKPCKYLLLVTACYKTYILNIPLQSMG